MKERLSIKKIYKKLSSIGNAVLILLAGLIVILLSFFFGFSYPVWILLASVLIYLWFEFRLPSSSMFEKANMFFITYGTVSVIMCCIYYMYDDEISSETISRFDSIDTITHDFLNYPMFFVHSLCMMFATVALFNMWLNDAKEELNDQKEGQDK